MRKKLSMMIALGALLCALVLAFTVGGQHRAFAISDYQRGHNAGYSWFQNICEGNGAGNVPGEYNTNSEFHKGFDDGQREADDDFSGNCHLY